MLPVLDNLDRALLFAENHDEASSKDFHQFFEGIVMVNQQLNEVLANMGVSPIASVGQPFDPHFHEAVAAEESAGFPPNTVTGELRRGYRIGDRVIRAAMVRVSVAARRAANEGFSQIDPERADDLSETPE
jgi:molecular chaperone GrpE